MKSFGPAWPVLALAFAADAALATPDARAEAEIVSLLSFVERSPCSFIRSGQAYDGAAARRHLERKYEYARRLLRTADEFIDHVGSGSSVTGEEYAVRCEGRARSAQSWLREELGRIRANPSPVPR